MKKMLRVPEKNNEPVFLAVADKSGRQVSIYAPPIESKKKELHAVMFIFHLNDLEIALTLLELKEDTSKVADLLLLLDPLSVQIFLNESTDSAIKEKKRADVKIEDVSVLSILLSNRIELKGSISSSLKKMEKRGDNSMSLLTKELPVASVLRLKGLIDEINFS